MACLRAGQEAAWPSYIRGLIRLLPLEAFPHQGSLPILYSPPPAPHHETIVKYEKQLSSFNCLQPSGA